MGTDVGKDSGDVGVVGCRAGDRNRERRVQRKVRGCGNDAQGEDAREQEIHEMHLGCLVVVSLNDFVARWAEGAVG